MILTLKRATIILNDATAAETFAIPNANYQQTINQDKQINFKGIHLNIKEATLHEALATICHTAPISMDEDISGFSAYPSAPYDYYYDTRKGALMGLSFSGLFMRLNRQHSSKHSNFCWLIIKLFLEIT